MRRAKRRRRRGGQTGKMFRPEDAAELTTRRFAPPLLCEEGNGNEQKGGPKVRPFL